jgi:hypothetical protein
VAISSLSPVLPSGGAGSGSVVVLRALLAPASMQPLHNDTLSDSNRSPYSGEEVLGVSGCQVDFAGLASQI